MRKITICLIAAVLLAQQGCSGGVVDATALKQLQGKWTVEEWTGYTLLGLYRTDSLASSGDTLYKGSRLMVSGTNTVWEIKVPGNMQALMLGLFSEGKDLAAKKEGDTRFYIDKAGILTLEAGKPGKALFAGIPGEGAYATNHYAAIWNLEGDTLIICKAKNPGEKCSEKLEIPKDDFFNTRIVLRRSEKAK